MTSLRCDGWTWRSIGSFLRHLKLGRFLGAVTRDDASARLLLDGDASLSLGSATCPRGRMQAFPAAVDRLQEGKGKFLKAVTC
ncbi:uncharacterized protein CLUP02_15997 [Colletotrichum lupini]|uniref:Uncharacterized protein n=1 Tax=Colletotrichum lupini TaxID=145971 RepID=A0A9Q8T938_9PEZI|nr:uncharacterized protein CLUP02_15997 [Colletotrichum lupini]UQC90467.1 hypothetical protein CLUP02_15997 [Colletotrichum lupini]